MGRALIYSELMVVSLFVFDINYQLDLIYFTACSEIVKGNSGIKMEMEQRVGNSEIT